MYFFRVSFKSSNWLATAAGCHKGSTASTSAQSARSAVPNVHRVACAGRGSHGGLEAVSGQYERNQRHDRWGEGLPRPLGAVARTYGLTMVHPSPLPISAVPLRDGSARPLRIGPLRPPAATKGPRRRPRSGPRTLTCQIGTVKAVRVGVVVAASRPFQGRTNETKGTIAGATVYHDRSTQSTAPTASCRSIRHR